MRMIITGHQRSSEAIRGPQWSSPARGGDDLDGRHEGEVSDGAVARREVDDVTAGSHLAGDGLEIVTCGVHEAVAIDGNRWPSTAIKGHQGRSTRDRHLASP